MSTCGWCHGRGLHLDACPVKPKSKGWFPGMGAKAKKRSDEIPQAHKHSYADFVGEVGGKEWYMCSCGKINKVAVEPVEQPGLF